MNKKGRNPRKKYAIILVLVIFLGVCIWKGMRLSYSVPYQEKENLQLSPYSEQEQAMKAIALSYLVYGCENCPELTGTVNEILETNSMGILIENFGIKRLEESNPSTAIFDSSTFIRNQVGEFRFLTSVQDVESGFYGAAFADDQQKCIWISYAGSVTTRDALACAELVLVPGLSSQEKSAFELFENVMNSSEVAKESYSVILTGHSLGGACASAVSCVSGCKAVIVNGAAGIVIDKMTDILGKDSMKHQITNYMTSPKNGHVSWMDLIQRLMFLGSYKEVDYYVYEENGLTTDTHSVFSFIRYSDENFENPELPTASEK